MRDRYPNLYLWGWPAGVHRAPNGYEHPWLIVTKKGTFGAWSRAEARATYAKLIR